MIASEFARPIALDMIGETPRAITITAAPEERAALAERFDIAVLDRLEATVTLHRVGDNVHAEGRFTARLAQSCVATGDPVPATLDAPFALRFVPEAELAAHEEVELREDDCDTVAYAGGAIDVGEAVAETMALALDPFPRAPHADAALKAAGVKSAEEAGESSGPFAALKGLLKD